MASSLFSVMPLISSSRSGRFCRMSSVSTPKRDTICLASAGPMPLIRPEARYSTCQSRGLLPSARVKFPAEPPHHCRQSLSGGMQAIPLRTGPPFPPKFGVDFAFRRLHCSPASLAPPPCSAGNSVYSNHWTMDLAGFGHLLMLPVLQRPFPFCHRLLPSLFYIHACYLPFCSLIYPQSRFRHLGDKKASMTKGKTPVVHSCL